MAWELNKCAFDLLLLPLVTPFIKTKTKKLVVPCNLMLYPIAEKGISGWSNNLPSVFSHI